MICSSYRIAAVFAVLASAALASATVDTAQAATRYPRMPATIDSSGADDPDLARLLEALTQAAKDRKFDVILTHLSPKFAWDRDFGGGYDEKASAAKNFANAVGMGDDDARPLDERWKGIADLIGARPLSRETLGDDGQPKRTLLCGPAVPKWDETIFERAMKATKADAIADWGWISGAVEVRARADAGAKVIETLKDEIVRVDEARYDPERASIDWVKVYTPSGKEGFVAVTSVQDITPARLCYGKDERGVWRIDTFIGGGD